MQAMSKRKMKLICYFLIMLITFTYSVSLGIGPSEHFDHMEILAEPDEFLLFWKLNSNNVVLEVHVRTSGWLAFGFGSDRNRKSSDIVIAWFNKDGTGHFSSRVFSKDIQHLKLINGSQAWLPISFTHKNGFVVLKFTRKLCFSSDSVENLSVGNHTNVVFGMGDEFSRGDAVFKETNFRYVQLNLFESSERILKVKLRYFGCEIGRLFKN